MTKLSALHRPPRATLALGLALLLALAATYAGSLRGDFLWDDDLHITANPTIVGPLGLKEIWTSARANYFPLVLTNFWLQHAAWELNPFGYRVVTLAFHAAAALLLWRLLLRLRVPGAWLGAAWWALHPVQVESVAWICELKNTQSAVFFLAAIWAWTRWLKPEPTAPPRRYYFLALLFALLAILSKPSTVMLPLALGLCGWWIHGRIQRRDTVALAPFFLLSAIAAGWTIWEQKFHSGAIGPEWSQTPAERMAIAGRVIWFYLGKLAWPDPLIFIYPRWEIDAGRVGAYLASGAALVVLGVMAWRSRDGRLRPALFAFAYFVALLFPILGFFSVYFFRYSFVGDHFQYLASMGPIALAAAGVGGCASPRVRAVAGTLVVVALAVASAGHSRAYLNNEALWRHTLARNPGAAMAWLNLADTLAQAGRYEEAIATFQRALTIKPTDPHGWNDLGNVLVLAGRADEAVPRFERALHFKPDYPEAHSNLGHALRQLGRADEAVAHYRRALAIKPDYPGALNNLGAELAERGEAAEARRLFERALQLQPRDASTVDNLAGALRALGRFDEALARHAEALRLDPRRAEAHANFGSTLTAAGRPQEALGHFERALELKPALVSARSRYAAALGALGREDDALDQLARATELAPSSFEARQNLGVALAKLGRVDEARNQFEHAVRVAPASASAHVNLGNTWAAAGGWDEAARHFATAVKLDGSSVTARTQLAVALVNKGDLPAAVPHFEQLLQREPSNADLHDQFGQVLNALGRRREAFGHLEEAARLRRGR